MTKERADWIRDRLALLQRRARYCGNDDIAVEACALEYRELMREWWAEPRPAWYKPRQEPKGRCRIRGTKVERVIMRLQGHSHE